MNAINALVKNSFRKLPLSATVNQILNGKIGSEYVVSGWIRTIRKQKNFYFAEITDGSADSTLQLVIPTQLITERNQEIGLTHGSSIQLHGKLLESPAKGQVVEVLANEIVTIGPCSGDEYPIHKSEMSEAYLRNQALPFRLRTEKFARLVKLKSQISNHIHRVLTDNEFIQMFPPVITEHDCEGGGASFRLEASKPDFFSKPAYLSVSTQLHLEMAAASLPRVYSFSPVFRAENQQTTKHLSEFWMLECEMSFLNDFNALLSTIEMLIQSCCDDSMTINRITYTDAVKELQSASKLSHFEHPVYWGADLQTEHERFLAEVVFKGPVFVTDYPAELKPFYMKLNSDERTVACCDLLVPGVGEVVGGSLREDNYDALKRSMEQKLGTKHNLDWYLDLRKFGGTKHGGFGLGFDRLIQYISGTSNIRDVVMIPRFCGSIKYPWLLYMSDLEAIFLAFCQAHPEGVTDKMFKLEHPHFSPTDLAKAINTLSLANLLEMSKSTTDGSLLYKAIKAEEAYLVSQLDPDEKIVYMCIKGADNRGIWTKDLKTRTNLHQTVLNKVLKSLEVTKKLIKSVRNVKNPTRKVYMLIGLDPSTEITGGPWFSESELDVEFINELCRVCLRFIASKSFSTKPGHLKSSGYAAYPSLSDVHDFILSSGITSTALGLEDVRMLLNRLVFDGEIERIVGVQGHVVSDALADGADEDDDDYGDIFVYRAIQSESLASSLASIPCGSCPVADLCSERAPISPANCEYYKQWLI